MTVNSKTQTLNFSEDVNEILCQIDVQLVKMAKDKLMADRFGAKICMNTEDFFLINKYREILLKKALNRNNCLKDFLIDDIISRIKQLLNRN